MKRTLENKPTLEDVEAAGFVVEGGVIRSPGKFKGEPWWAVLAALLLATTSQAQALFGDRGVIATAIWRRCAGESPGWFPQFGADRCIQRERRCARAI